MRTSATTTRISPSCASATARRPERPGANEDRPTAPSAGGGTSIDPATAVGGHRMTRSSQCHDAQRASAGPTGRRGPFVPGLALLAGMLLCAACTSSPQPGPAGRIAATGTPHVYAATPESIGMVDIGQLVPDIDLDIRYAGPHNFTGRPVDGYGAAKCYLLRPAAEALRNAELELRQQGLRLRVFDCYRPARAVRQFVRWAADPDDQSTRAEYYPALAKAALVPGYIS